ncbi:MAG: MptD family putative ECF transporter S component [Bacteroides sp.]|nr:MptD family putative ECF transporter S component [Bacteroides sp.]
MLTNAVFSLWIAANYMLFFFERDTFLASRAESVGQEFADTIDKMLPPWTFAVLVAVCFVCGIIGGLLGRKMLSKHFKKAGIA